MKTVLAAVAAMAAASGSAMAQQESFANPRGMVANFDIATLGPLLTELGAVWQQAQMPSGQPYLQVSVGGNMILLIMPAACQSANYTGCVGLNTLAPFEGDNINYQTVAAFNQKYWFSTAGILADGSGAYVSRYDIADYGIARGNIAASIQNLVAVAEIFDQELSTSGKTVSLEGYADDMAARLLNGRGVTAFAGAGALGAASKHQVAMEESAELVRVLLKDESAPRNKIENIGKR